MALADELMDMELAADYLHVPHRSLQNNWRTWKVPAYKIGKRIMFAASEVDQWIKDQRIR